MLLGGICLRSAFQKDLDTYQGQSVLINDFRSSAERATILTRAHQHALPAVSCLAISRTGNGYRNANDGMYHASCMRNDMKLIKSRYKPERQREQWKSILIYHHCFWDRPRALGSHPAMGDLGSRRCWSGKKGKREGDDRFI